MESGDSSSQSATAKLCSFTAALQIDDSKEKNHTSRVITAAIDSIKKQIVSDRYTYIKEKMEENKRNLTAMTQHIYNLTKARSTSALNTDSSDEDLLSRRLDEALCAVNSLELSAGEKDSSSCQEDSSHSSSTVLPGSNFEVKNEVCPVRIPELPKLPPYTTWIFLDRNQRMAEDQSIVGRRRIYYDQTCGEALLCSDSEEDVVEDEEEKKEFGSAEDYIIRMTIQQVGLSDAVLDSLAKSLKKGSEDIKTRYETFQKSDKQEISATIGESEVKVKAEDALVEKDLDAALDSFDNLFCRRCLVFDCRLHGCSQDLVFPAEKQIPCFNLDDGLPCGSQCYRLGRVATTNSEMARNVEGRTQSSGHDEQTLLRKKMQSSVRIKTRSQQSESASSNAKVVSESSESDLRINQESTSESTSPLKVKVGGKVGVQKKNSKRIAERVLDCMGKKQKNMGNLNSESNLKGCASPQELDLRSHACNSNKNSSAASACKGLDFTGTKKLGKKCPPKEESENSSSDEVQNECTSNMVKDMLNSEDKATIKGENAVENVCKVKNNCESWKTFEQSLFVKGLEIFGRNSCLIARNLLSGMKTCLEVFQYMNYVPDSGSCGAAGVNSITEGHGNFQSNGALGNKLLARSRFFRRRGRVRRLKYTWKSAGYPSIRKRTSENKDQPCRQYNPCGCQTACGKQCPCLLNGTCCEKYCGCPKMCKNRFRGCHCAKSQCRSRQCPCFAAGRECDPDVCRNCWVGCGDGTFGGPNQRGDNYECRNMKLLLRQQQRVLLGRSDVSGWGAFLKNSVGKNEYLGEYTGELISHREADKRGKIYDRENSSFLFNLNDQFVLDAYRKGDKLKFANHSHDPNCYAKVIMVAGDHRVGIFAKDRISAGEEIFYDYLYDPNHAPAWARKSDAPGLKKDEHPSIGRPRKLA